MKNCSNHSPLDCFAAALIDGLKAELYLTPKPGLVDLCNSGSHQDLSFHLMSRSISLLRGYLEELCFAIKRSSSTAELVLVGQQAEQRIYLELGTNCHRGGLFLCSLLLVSASRADPLDPQSFAQAIRMTAQEFFVVREVNSSHGDVVRRDFPKAGIVAEALNGLPAMFEVALPVLLGGGATAINDIYLAMARLMRRVEDSTSLYRCGNAGLASLREAGARLEFCLSSGCDPVPLLFEIDQDFCQQNLTMGGVADLLGLSLGYASYLRQAQNDYYHQQQISAFDLPISVPALVRASGS